MSSKYSGKQWQVPPEVTAHRTGGNVKLSKNVENIDAEIEKRIAELRTDGRLTSVQKDEKYEEILIEYKKEIKDDIDKTFSTKQFTIEKVNCGEGLVTGSDDYEIKRIVENFLNSNKDLKKEYMLKIVITPKILTTEQTKNKPNECTIKVEFECKKDETQTQYDARISNEEAKISQIMDEIISKEKEQVYQSTTNVKSTEPNETRLFSEKVLQNDMVKFESMKTEIEEKLKEYMYVHFKTDITITKCCTPTTKNFIRRLKSCDDKYLKELDIKIKNMGVKNIKIIKQFGKKRRTSKRSKKRSKRRSKKYKRSKRKSKK
jgi:hypothetical protein